MHLVGNLDGGGGRTSLWKDATPDRVRAGGLEVWIHKRHPKWDVIMPRPISKSARSRRLTKALKIIHGASVEPAEVGAFFPAH